MTNSVNAVAAITYAIQLAANANAEYCKLIALGCKPGGYEFGYASTQREYRIAIAELDISTLAARGVNEQTEERRTAAFVADLVAKM